MMYLDSTGVWVRRDLVPDALGDMPLPRGQARDPKTPRINNGISGDARRSSVALGKQAFDIKVEYAVRQINEFIPQTKQGDNR
jgi:hypothetical protein